MRRFLVQEDVATSVLLSRFCMSSLVRARSSTLAWSWALTVCSSSLSDCISSLEVSNSSLALWSSSLLDCSSSLVDLSSSLDVSSSSTVLCKVSFTYWTSCSNSKTRSGGAWVDRAAGFRAGSRFSRPVRSGTPPAAGRGCSPARSASQPRAGRQSNPRWSSRAYLHGQPGRPGRRPGATPRPGQSAGPRAPCPGCSCAAGRSPVRDNPRCARGCRECHPGR